MVEKKKSLKISAGSYAQSLGEDLYETTMNASYPIGDPLAYILNRVWFKNPWHPDKIMFSPTISDALTQYNYKSYLSQMASSYFKNVKSTWSIEGFIDYMCMPNSDGKCPAFGMTSGPFINANFTQKDWLYLLVNQQLQQHVGKGGPLEYIVNEVRPPGQMPYETRKLKITIEAHSNALVALILLLHMYLPKGKKGWNYSLWGGSSYVDMLQKSIPPYAATPEARRLLLDDLMKKLYELKIEKKIGQTRRSYYYSPKTNPDQAAMPVGLTTVENYIDDFGRLLKPSTEEGVKKETSLAFAYEDVVDKAPPTTTPDGNTIDVANVLSYTSELMSWPQASHVLLDIDTAKKSVTTINGASHNIPFYKRLQITLKDLVPPDLRLKLKHKLPQGSYAYWILGYLQFLNENNQVFTPGADERLNPPTLNIVKSHLASYSTNFMPLSKDRDWTDANTWSAVSAQYLKNIGVAAPYTKMSTYPDMLVDKEYKVVSAPAAFPLMSLFHGSAQLLDTPNSWEKDLPASLQSQHKIITIGNRVAKYNSVQTSPIQSFMIDTQDATSDKELIALYDSQLFYDSIYEYAVTSLILMPVVYSSYVLSTEATDTSTGLMYSFDYNEKIAWEVREVGTIKPSQTKSISNFKYPPVPAWVEFYPFRGINNKILFNFKHVSVGGDEGVILKEIKKENWEAGWQKAQDFYKTQNPEKAVGDTTVPFQDQPWQSVRVYQLSGDVPPTSVKDFETLKKEVNIIKEGSHTILDIEPNVQHYFLFRAVGNIGLVSYPSQVYSVKIFDEGGTVYPLVDIVEIGQDTPPERKTEKTFTQKVRLEPALLQSAPNIKQKIPDLGYLTPSVFSDIDVTQPQFKMRITSNKTGRKVDFNILYRKDKHDPAIGVLSATPDDVLVSWEDPLAAAVEKFYPKTGKCSVAGWQKAMMSSGDLVLVMVAGVLTELANKATNKNECENLFTLLKKFKDDPEWSDLYETLKDISNVEEVLNNGQAGEWLE